MKSTATSYLTKLASETKQHRTEINEKLDFQIATKIFGYHRKVGPSEIWCSGDRKEEYEKIPRFSSDWNFGKKVLEKINEFNIPIDFYYSSWTQPTVWIVHFNNQSFTDTSLEKCLCEAILTLFK